MGGSSPPLQTPSKRKRGHETPVTPIKFSFALNREEDIEDGGSSPRTTVAHRFKGLDLHGGGGGVAILPTGKPADAGDELLSKRQKPDQPMSDVSHSFGIATAYVGPAESRSEEQIASFENGESGEQGSPNSSRKRAGTPPLKLKRDPSQDGSENEDDDEEIVHIVDPVRAALTWHEDEITVYDPDDKDDGGTGINGVGFRPTPAIAQARSMRRRQQITEYRKREENEARARRTLRRRDGEAPSRINKASPRKVRFSDSELLTIAVTTI